MIGLRVKETEKFLRFFELVQKEAEKIGCVFFLDAGLGDTVIGEVYECESAFGWLLPKDKSAEFELFFMKNSKEQHEYDDYYYTMEYEITSEGIIIRFIDYGCY